MNILCHYSNDGNIKRNYATFLLSFKGKHYKFKQELCRGIQIVTNGLELDPVTGPLVEFYERINAPVGFH